MGGFYRQAVGARDCNFATRWRSECLGQTQEDRIWGGQAFEGGAIRADKNKSCAAAAPATSAIVDGFGTRLPHIGTSAIAASGKIRSFTAKTGDCEWTGEHMDWDTGIHILMTAEFPQGVEWHEGRMRPCPQSEIAPPQ